MRPPRDGADHQTRASWWKSSKKKGLNIVQVDRAGFQQAVLKEHNPESLGFDRRTDPHSGGEVALRVRLRASACTFVPLGGSRH